MRTAIFFLLFFVNPSVAYPAWHLYLIPVVGGGTSKTDIIKPDYIPSTSRRSLYNYGKQKYGLVAADVTDSDDQALIARNDVTKIPDNLDQPVGSSLLGAVQKALESRNMPGNWITAITTYR